MIKLTNFLSSLVILVIGCFMIAGCTQPVTSTSTNPPSDLTAVATGPSTILVTWIRDPADVGTDTIFATDTFAGSKIPPVLVPNPDTMGTLTGLDTGITYTITVHSSSGGSSTSFVMMTNPPSGLVALSLDSDTINIEWNRAQGESAADTIIVTPSAGAPVPPIIIPAPNNGPISIPNLSEGVVYSIAVHSSSGVSAPLQWMTAERTSGLRIYETNDTNTGDPKALILGTHNTYTDSLSGVTNADFVLESVDTAVTLSGISLTSAKLYNPSWNATLIDSSADSDHLHHNDYISGGLNNNYNSANFQTDQMNSKANSYNLPDDDNYASVGSRVLIVTTADNHLALVEIVPDASGTLFSTNSYGFKYLTLNVSYQSAVGQPYAGRGRSSSPTGPVRRISAH